MDREQITVITREKGNKARVKELLTEWYRQRADNIFRERVEAWYPRFERYDIQHPKVFVRQMRSQWGNCNAKGKMTLNLKLVMVPRQFIDHVIVHALCHLIEHNHSPAKYITDNEHQDMRGRPHGWGRRQCNVCMKPVIFINREIVSPPKSVFEFGGARRGSNA